MPNITRFSGYRLGKEKLTPEKYSWRMIALRDEIQKKYIPFLNNIDWGYFLDDAERNIPLIDSLMNKVQNGELYFVDDGKEFIGLAAITPIHFGRNGYIEAIAMPKFHGSLAVGKAMGDLIVYAFKEYVNDGLGLKKLIARVAADNMQVIEMLGKAGFNPCGILKGEMLCGGVPRDIVMLELLNPEFFGVQVEQISYERSTEQSGIQSDQLREPTATSASPVSDGGRTGSTDTATDRTGGTEFRVDSSAVASTEQLQWNEQPVGTGGSGRSVRPEPDEPDTKLVHAKPGRSTAGTNARSKPKSRRRVRK
jgi:RimJ/RimL family protein N-acetyltransferase